MNEIEIVKADLGCPAHQLAVVALMDAYSADPMGDAQPLSEFARQNLVAGLQAHPTTLIFLAFHQGQPRGIATCFRGFSTFAARPLVNIHDFYVDPIVRGLGIGRMLLDAVADEARVTGCCKLTLEVQHSNTRARAIYDRYGFTQAVYAADAAAGGGSLFMVKPL